MNSSNATQSSPVPVDEDLAEQALPGHGIPSQDPDPAAQTALEPQDVAREAHTVLMGGGAIVGAAAGAGVGIMVAGPVGVLVGGTLGAVAGALGAAAAGSAGNLGEASAADITPDAACTCTSTTAVAAADPWC